MSRPFPKLLPWLFAFAALIAACSNEPFDPSSWKNAPPVASIWVLPANPDSLQPTTYNQATFHWSGTDSDGFITGYYVNITVQGQSSNNWMFTTSEETTATYSTDESGRAFPTLSVVAQDDRAALSDTVSVTIPLVNFPPLLEFADNFTPVKTSFGAASFEFFGFDLDGDSTLLPWIEYRFEGSDPDSVYGIGDPLADPTKGWVREARPPTRFSLVLRDIPQGDPAQDFDQTLYVRIADEAGGLAELSHTWKVYQAIGDVLLIDDAPNTVSLASRDTFYRDALDQLLPGQHSVWDISDGAPDRDDDIRLTLEQFQWLVWYTGNSESPTLLRVQGILQDYLSKDLDPDTPGTQSGHLFLETQSAVGASSNLSTTFRSQVLGLEKNPEPRSNFRITSQDLASLGGALDVEPQSAGLPALASIGRNYLDGTGFFFGIYGFVMTAGTAELYRFENYDYLHDRRSSSPLVAVRKPDTGTANAVTLGFQLEFCNALGNAIEALGIILQDELGHTVTLPSGGKP
jgi:hypothetical protein